MTAKDSLHDLKNNKSTSEHRDEVVCRHLKEGNGDSSERDSPSGKTAELPPRQPYLACISIEEWLDNFVDHEFLSKSGLKRTFIDLKARWITECTPSEQASAERLAVLWLHVYMTEAKLTKSQSNNVDPRSVEEFVRAIQAMSSRFMTGAKLITKLFPQKNNPMPETESKTKPKQRRSSTKKIKAKG